MTPLAMMLALAPAGRILAVLLLYVMVEFRTALRRAAFIASRLRDAEMKLVFQAPRQEKLATTVHSNGQVYHNGMPTRDS